MFDDPAEVAPLELGAVAASVPPGGQYVAAPWRRMDPSVHRGTFAWVFVASTVAHGALALRFQGGAERLRERPAISQVDVELSRPPPPPPPPVAPEPPRPLEPQVAKPAARPVLARQPENLPQPSPVVESNLPASDEGILPPAPPGTAAPSPQPVVLAPPPPPPPPAPVIEAKEGANYLKNPRPAYPHLALREGWQGLAVLRVRVLADGRPGVATLQKSTGHGVLDDAAVEAVKGWTFVPATQGGQPIVGWVTVPIEFRLQ